MILETRPGEHVLRTEDILASIKAHGESIAVIFLSGVHYYTGISTYREGGFKIEKLFLCRTEI